MPYTRKQIVISASILYLILVTALAGYVCSRISQLSIPIPDVLTGFTTALPIVSGLLLQASHDLTRRQERHRGTSRAQTPRPPLVIIANTIIFIYSTVVITLLGTHAAPPRGLNCGLQETWRNLYSKKNDQAIKTIQDALNCCGFSNSHDMAWPFPGKGTDARSCEKTFHRTAGCLGPWKQQEQNMAGLFMGVVALVVVWQLAIIVTPTKSDSWLHRILPGRISRVLGDEEHAASNGTRRRIDYLPDFSRFSDNVAEEVSDDEEEENTPRPTIERFTNAVADAEERADEREHATVDNAWTRT